jgi:hypothetical protein
MIFWPVLVAWVAMAIRQKVGAVLAALMLRKMLQTG